MSKIQISYDYQTPIYISAYYWLLFSIYYYWLLHAQFEILFVKKKPSIHKRRIISLPRMNVRGVTTTRRGIVGPTMTFGYRYLPYLWFDRWFCGYRIIIIIIVVRKRRWHIIIIVMNVQPYTTRGRFESFTPSSYRVTCILYPSSRQATAAGYDNIRTGPQVKRPEPVHPYMCVYTIHII